MSRRTLEKELLEKIKEKDAIINGISDALMLLDARTMEILEVNHSFLDNHKMSREEVLGKTCHQIAHHLDLPCYEMNIDCPGDITRSTGEKATAEHIHLDRDGRPLYFEITTCPLKNEKGEVHRIIHLSRNITDRKLVEEELQNERNKMQRYLDTTDTIIVALDKSGTITMLNRYGLELLGYKEEEIVGENWFEMVLPPSEGKEKVHPLFQRITQGDTASTGYLENEVITSSGMRLLIAWRNTVLRDAEGRIIGTLSAGMDITDRKRAEEAMQESEEKYRTLFNQSVDAIYLHDAEGNILDVNRVAILYSGYSKEELLSLTVFDLHPDKTRMDEILRKWGQWPLGQIFTIEAIHRRKNNSLYPVEVTTGKVHFGNRELILAGVRDITERKQAEEALRRSHDRLEIRVQARTAELEHKNQELHEFTFIAAHDLSEPLRKIQAFGSFLEERSNDRLTEKERDYISRMTGAANRMHELIKAILEYSLLETKARLFRPAKLDDIVRDAVIDLEVPIRKIDAQVEIGPLPTLNGEPKQLRQLFQNLISNSLKYCRSEVTTCVRIHGEENNGNCHIFVEDNGIGFDEKYLEKIFKPFQSLHGKDEYLGTGIGLAICKKIVERHGGTIIAKSTPGKGSTFIVTLPLG